MRNPVALTTLRKRADNMLKKPERTGWRAHKRGYIWVQPATLITLLNDHDQLASIQESAAKVLAHATGGDSAETEA